MREWMLRPKVFAIAAFGVAVAAVATWLLWPSPSGPEVRERHYASTTACLLTDDKGLAGEPARAAWAGMQEASVDGSVKVQYLAIAGPQTAANGLSYFNSLGVQRCAVIVAVGDVPVAAMMDGRARFPEIRQVAVGGAAAEPVTAVDASSPSSIQDGVREILAKA
jgi:hypothetical protein